MHNTAAGPRWQSGQYLICWSGLASKNKEGQLLGWPSSGEVRREQRAARRFSELPLAYYCSFLVERVKRCSQKTVGSFVKFKSHRIQPRRFRERESRTFCVARRLWWNWMPAYAGMTS